MYVSKSLQYTSTRTDVFVPIIRRYRHSTSPYKNSLCVGAVLWCVETLRLLKVPLCVGPVLWCVRTLSFQSSPSCGLHALVCEDFEF